MLYTCSDPSGRQGEDQIHAEARGAGAVLRTAAGPE